MKKLLFITLILNVIFFSHAKYNPAEEKVIICGVCKNVARFLPNMIKKIEAVGKAFKDYRVIIYENNSTDRTARILQNWMNNNSKVHITSEVLSQEQMYERTKAHALRDQAPNRMEMIAYGRNYILKQAIQSVYDDYKFLIMTDMDFARGWQVNDVLACFALEQDWDALTANGVGGGANYYDRYALRDDRFPLGPELLGEDFWTYVRKEPFSLNRSSGLKKVYSAFGGLGIYKRKALYGCSYDGYVTEEYKQFLADLINKHLNKNNSQVKNYKRIIRSNDLSEFPVIVQANCGYDGPVCCEHSTLHAGMILRGYDKIFVNPRLICRY